MERTSPPLALPLVVVGEGLVWVIPMELVMVVMELLLVLQSLFLLLLRIGVEVLVVLHVPLLVVGLNQAALLLASALARVAAPAL